MNALFAARTLLRAKGGHAHEKIEPYLLTN